MSEIKRKLATIQRIDKVLPIEGADNIVKITFKSIGWSCVTNKSSNPYEGKQVVYLEVDSMLPSTNPVFAFMEPYHYRVKTVKLRGTVSQGLAIPLDDFPGLIDQIGGDVSTIEEGLDVTDIIGVVKYEVPETVQIRGDTKGPFPGFIEKTDEPRAQGFEQAVLEKLLAEHEFDVTVKMDGSSGTYFLFNGEFGVCSRNQELKDTESNIFWKIARKYNIEKRMRKYAATGKLTNFAIQGEVAGPGIQSNRIGLTEVKLFVFTIQNLDTAKRLDNNEIAFVLDELNHVFDDTFTQDDNCELFQMVPWVVDVPPLKTLEDVAKLSEGTFIITDKVREGIVLRAKDDASISFKFINPSYLIKFGL
jgi:RNA ligase (TIGR02306 family)